MNNDDITRLAYNVFIEYEIEVLTGLAIGGSDTGIQIGGVDKVVIRNPLNDEPYIPGSSLRGKMRSSLEKAMGLPLRQKIGRIRIHSATSAAEYAESPICQIFGVTGENDWSRPSRVLVRDTPLSTESREAMAQRRLDLPYTEIKTEVAIDRITSAAVPRTLERVPAGTVFGPGQMVFNMYEGDNDYRPNLLGILLAGMRLVEDGYLGGSGSRGSGQIRFRNLVISYRTTSGPEGILSYMDRVELARADQLSELNVPALLGEG
jgi:CRISPR-associated protein Csm3